MNDNAIPEDIAKLSFEEALKSLEELVRSLEKGDTSLDQAIQVYERGNFLRRQCSNMLEAAKMRVEKIQIDQGNITKSPLDGV